jgi:oxygen-independent coproporphyrinogen-3 oxidase
MAEPAQAERFALTHELLAAAGYAAYAVSNFAAAPEHRSRHNRKYWEHTAYLGIGPSAHSFDGVARRWWNERRLADWERALESEEGAASAADNALPIAGGELLGSAELVLEALALGLRTTAGVDLEALERRHGIDVLAANEARIATLQSRGLLSLQPPARLVPALRGLAVADALARELEIPVHD